MNLPTHGRYDYTPIHGRPIFDWVPGRRLAVYIALNIEWYAFGDGLREEIAPGGPEPDVLNYSWRDYGNRVGVWRLLELFRSLDLPIGLLVNSAIYTHAPEIPAAFRARGDEILAHGRTNSEAQGQLTEAAEASLIHAVTAEITANEGASPKGWLGPWISESARTPDLLQEAGYAYTLDWCMDDQPVWLRTRNGRLLAVPYPQEANDSNAIVARRMGAAEFADLIVDQLDTMLEQSEHGPPLVMGMALHPYITGQPFRLRHLRRAFKHLAAQRERLWLTTPGAIAHRWTEVSDR